MRDLKALFTAIYTGLGILWPVTALAASQSLGDGLSLKTVAIAVLLSTLSGLTSLLHQMHKDLKEYGHIQHKWVYITEKMLGANTAGLLMLFITENKFDPNTQGGMIIVAAFGGILFLQNRLGSLMKKEPPNVQ